MYKLFDFIKENALEGCFCLLWNLKKEEKKDEIIDMTNSPYKTSNL